MEKSNSSCDYLPTNADLCLKFSKFFLIHDCFFHLGKKENNYLLEEHPHLNILSKETTGILYLKKWEYFI